MKHKARTATQAFWIDAAHDGTQERYGEQLRRWRQAFTATGEEEGGVTRDPLHFALAAWEVATQPVNESPYVRTHPRVLDATCHRAEEAGGPLAVVELAAPPPVPVPGGWSGWQRGDGDDEPAYVAGTQRIPTVLSTLELRIPLSGDRLPTPTRARADGLPNLDDAQASLEALVAALNAEVTPFLRELDSIDGGPAGAAMLEWLRTQIEADKATAEAAGATAWRYVAPGLSGTAAECGLQADGDGKRLEFDERRVVADVGFHDDDLLRPVEAIHIALHDPADVAARCAAELTLLDEHTPVPSDATCPACAGSAAPCETLRRLAYGYRLRPGWRPEWRPAV
jgi:hypothetical protein